MPRGIYHYCANAKWEEEVEYGEYRNCENTVSGVIESDIPTSVTEFEKLEWEIEENIAICHSGAIVTITSLTLISQPISEA